MAVTVWFDQYKIHTSDYLGRDIAGLPNRPALSAQQLKERFDALSKEIIAEKFNAMCDGLNDVSHNNSVEFNNLWFELERRIVASTEDLTPGVSDLDTGVVYLVYE